MQGEEQVLKKGLYLTEIMWALTPRPVSGLEMNSQRSTIERRDDIGLNGDMSLLDKSPQRPNLRENGLIDQ
jgi:hypothetical protein